MKYSHRVTYASDLDLLDNSLRSIQCICIDWAPDKGNGVCVCVCVLCTHVHTRQEIKLDSTLALKQTPGLLHSPAGFSEGDSNTELRLLDLVYCYSSDVRFIIHSIFQSLWHKMQTYPCGNIHWIQINLKIFDPLRLSSIISPIDTLGYLQVREFYNIFKNT